MAELNAQLFIILSKPYRAIFKHSFFRPFNVWRFLRRTAWTTVSILYFSRAYLEKRISCPGNTIKLEPSLAKFTRRGLDLDTYWYAHYSINSGPYELAEGSVFHLIEPDINQEIYGVSGYLSAIPSALLNESATLCRRKYYLNRSHAGYIRYVTDPTKNQEDIDAMSQAMISAKGSDNFRNRFMYSPGGRNDGIKIIPLSEMAAKDEFLNVKNMSRDNILAAHWVPLQIMGIEPNNFRIDAKKASNVFVRNELISQQKRIEELYY